MGTFWHYLRKNAQKEQPTHLIFYDTETNETDINFKESKHTLKLGVACYVLNRRNGSKNTEEWMTFTKKEEFWDFVEKKAYSKTKLYVFAHNQQFDFMIVDGFRELKKRGWEIKNWFIDSRIFILRVFKGNKTIILLDTYNYLQITVKSMGNKLNLPKLEIDFNNCNMKELEVYCKRDVEIIKEFMLHFLNFMKKYNLGNFKSTIASCSFSAYRHRFLNKKVLIHADEEATKLERESYRGGRTEAFFIGQKQGETFYKLDINSLYPFIMRNNEFPVRLIKVKENPSLEALSTALEEYLVIADVEFETDERCIAVRKERLIFPIGKIRAVLCTPELKYLLKKGFIKRVFKYALYRGDYLFNDYIDYFYALRKEFKKKGATMDNYLAKLFMNCLYGKFGQRNSDYIYLGKSNDRDTIIETYYNMNTGKKTTLYSIMGNKYLKGDKKEAIDSFVAIASHVTAYARMYMYKLIQICSLKNVYYCDTDSIITNQVGYDNLRDYIDEYELGKLKVEEKADFLEIWNVKHYKFGEALKIKGIKRNAVQTEKMTFVQEQFLKIRTLLRKGIFGTVIVRKVTKRLKTAYKKGIVTLSGNVEPFEIDWERDRELEQQKQEAKFRKLFEIKRKEKYKKHRKSDYFDEQTEDKMLNRHERYIDWQNAWRDCYIYY